MAKRYIAAFFFLAITVLSCTDPGSASQLPVYSLKYDGNGNTQGSVPAGASAESGNWIALSENTGFLMRISDENESHAFVSWNAEPDGSGDSFSPGSYMTLTENTTLFAQYGVFQLESRGPAGGYVFYDKGSYSDGWRYLEAAPSDQSTGDGVTWCGSTYRYTDTGVTATAIGAGNSNTQTLVIKENGDSTANNAARLCFEYSHTNESGDQYADWFLPSKDELYAMYSELYLKNTGGFAYGEEYWSSSEVSTDSTRAYSQKFNSEAYQNETVKFNSFTFRKVRAVRSF